MNLRGGALQIVGDNIGAEGRGTGGEYRGVGSSQKRRPFAAR